MSSFYLLTGATFNKNKHFGQNQDFSLSLMTYCSFCVFNMIILLVDLNALVYVDMKNVSDLQIWRNFIFLFFERNGFTLDQSAEREICTPLGG